MMYAVILGVASIASIIYLSTSLEFCEKYHVLESILGLSDVLLEVV